MAGLLGRISAFYSHHYERRPILTLMCTNALLGGISDCMAQTLTAVRERAVRTGHAKDDVLAMEIHEVDEKLPGPKHGLIPDSKLLPPPYDFARTIRFMSFGFFNAPIQYYWFTFLDRKFPMGSSPVAPLKRVAADQFGFAPFGLTWFFSYMTLAEGKDITHLKNKVSEALIPTVKANWLVWIPVQAANFWLVPLKFQIPFVSTVGIFWNMYLSLSNASMETEE